MDFEGAALRLGPSDIAHAAAALKSEPETVGAVRDVESSGAGFLPDNRPVILDEAHIFSRLTHHRFDKTHPNISSLHWNRALYGAPGAHQYDRLAEAIRLDRTAALEACSWGMFQTLGMNFALCGFNDVEAMVKAYAESEGEQLNGFVEFCLRGRLDRLLAARDWVRFALLYNGPLAQRANHYDLRLAQAYQRRKRRSHSQPSGLAFHPATVGRPPVWREEENHVEEHPEKPAGSTTAGS